MTYCKNTPGVRGAPNAVNRAAAWGASGLGRGLVGGVILSLLCTLSAFSQSPPLSRPEQNAEGPLASAAPEPAAQNVSVQATLSPKRRPSDLPEPPAPAPAVSEKAPTAPSLIPPPRAQNVAAPQTPPPTDETAEATEAAEAAEGDYEPEVNVPQNFSRTTEYVAKRATTQSKVTFSNGVLIGIFGKSNHRRALVRINNSYERLAIGDSFNGGQVQAITEREMIYVKNGTAYRLGLVQEE